MNKIKHVKGQVSLLVIAILVLCAGFFIISCGSKSDPQSKSKENNKGAFAVDFSKCPFNNCFVDAQGSSVNPYPNMEGEEFTVEAWVKNKTNPSLSGVVFSHMDSNGAALFVNKNVPKLAIRRAPVASDVETSRSILTECAKLGADATSTECIVQALDEFDPGEQDTVTGIAATLVAPSSTPDIIVTSKTLTSDTLTDTFNDPATGDVITLSGGEQAHSILLPSTTISSTPNTDTWNITVDATTIIRDTVSEAVNLAKNVWTHIAGVLTTEDQSNGPNGCSIDTDENGTVQGGEVPHLAIYVNGELKNCASSGEAFADNPQDSNKLKVAVHGHTVALDDFDLAVTDENEVNSRMNFDGVIDEVRVWGYARTENELKQCMDKELGVGGACDRGDPRLVNYYRFNEGEGSNVADFSGLGFQGTLLGIDKHGEEPHFEDGWVKGYPDLQPAD